MREINYRALKENMEDMINALEYDAMRSPGKMKVNAESLYYLQMLKKHYNNYKLPPKEVIDE